MEPQQPTTHRTDSDDTEGHTMEVGIGYTDGDESDDVKGYGVTGGYRPTQTKAGSDDDVAGYLSGALGSKKRTEDAG